MGHVKQKKSTNASTPPDMGTEMVPTKGHFPHSTKREPHARPAYPEQLNVGELINQINCRNNIHNDISNDRNNNSNRNNNSTHRTTNQPSQQGEVVDVEKGSEESPEEELQRHQRQKPLFRRLITFIRNLWIGAKFTIANDDLELEELEAPQRYRPDSLAQICKTTKFSESEIKRMYRGFKAHCPNGMVKEDTFKLIYAQFFPQGANTGLYAHYVFNTLDKDHTGTLSFEKFVQGLSILSRGTLEEKLCWTFQLYDINSDGQITKEEMSDIVTAIYNLMANSAEDKIDEDRIKAKVDRIFDKMDRNHDGVVTIDEFLDCCRCDKAITNSMLVFDSTI